MSKNEIDLTYTCVIPTCENAVYATVSLANYKKGPEILKTRALKEGWQKMSVAGKFVGHICKECAELYMDVTESDDADNEAQTDDPDSDGGADYIPLPVRRVPTP